MNNHILRNLYNLIRNSALKYLNEFVWQDIELTVEFKNAYTSYLDGNNYDIEFLGSTAVITSPSAKYIYVPNQWFVIASYAVDVFEELQTYKKYFKKVSDRAGRRYDEYAKELRNSNSVHVKSNFILNARSVFASITDDAALIEESTARLWRFVDDYSWWSGQKTIDRGDFHLSVILNMLNLVNASQSYVADIVSAYATDPSLKHLVKSIDGFTVNMDTLDTEVGYNFDKDDNEGGKGMVIRERGNSYSEPIPKPGRVKIKIGEKNSVKEIKYRG